MRQLTHFPEDGRVVHLKDFGKVKVFLLVAPNGKEDYVEMCQSTTARSQRTHIFCSILSFLALEKKRLEEGITWYESKRRIISDSLFLYLKQPLIKLPTPAR